MPETDKFDDCFRGFYHHNRAYYGDRSLLPKGIEDDVMLGFYHPEGGTVGEMKMEWVDLGRGKADPHFCIFDDAWEALGRLPDLITALAGLNDKMIQPTEFCRLLVSLGFRDITQVTPEREAFEEASPMPESTFTPEILPPGPELDALVGEILGECRHDWQRLGPNVWNHTCSKCRHLWGTILESNPCKFPAVGFGKRYSTDPTAMMTCWNWLEAQGYKVSVTTVPDGSAFEFCGVPSVEAKAHVLVEENRPMGRAIASCYGNSQAHALALMVVKVGAKLKEVAGE